MHDRAQRRHPKPAGAATQTVKVSDAGGGGQEEEPQDPTILVTGEEYQARERAPRCVGPRWRRQGADRRRLGCNLTRSSSPTRAPLESFVIPTATTVSVDAATIITLGDGARQRRQGGAVVRQRDHLCRNDPSPRGGKAGDGGFVEVSNHGQLAFTNVDRARHAAEPARALDPQDLLIVFGLAMGSNRTNPAQIET